jgi:glycosyltransferase involved in cell wall biosynthesis
MSKEKVLISSDSIQGPTGFANNSCGIAFCLAKEFEVHILGLQSVHDEKVKIKMEGETREVIQHANIPRGKNRWDFGHKSLPKLLDNLEPEIYLTVNDIQMVQHVPNVMCPNQINLQVMDLPSKRFLSDETMRIQLEGQLQRFKEKFPRETKWIQLAPQDGDPPMPQWANTYKIADQCVAMSRYGKHIFKKFFDMDIPVIYHGVDCSTFKNEPKPKELEERFVVGSLHRNQPRKQPVRLMRAFAKFAKDKPDALLHMQMDWNDEFGWPIQYFAQMFKLMPKMIQPKRVGMSREEVAKTYNMWDVNTNATAGEGFSIPVIEGFACGLPCLGTSYTTSQELIIEGSPSPRGQLVKVKDFHWQKLDTAAVQRALVDEDDLARTMEAYYNDRDMLKEHSKNSEEWCKEYTSWSVIEPQWIRLVSKVLAGEECV